MLPAGRGAQSFLFFKNTAPSTAAKPSGDPIPITQPLPWREPGHFPISFVLHRTAATKAVLKDYPDGNAPDFELRVQQEMQARPLTMSGRFIEFAANHKLLPEA